MAAGEIPAPKGLAGKEVAKKRKNKGHEAQFIWKFQKWRRKADRKDGTNKENTYALKKGMTSC